MAEPMSILERLENIQHKVNEITMRLSFAEKDLRAAQEENAELKKQIKILQAKPKPEAALPGNLEKDFQKSEIFHKLVLNYSNDGASAEQMRALLEEYIKDIDQCIALLSN